MKKIIKAQHKGKSVYLTQFGFRGMLFNEDVFSAKIFKTTKKIDSSICDVVKDNERGKIFLVRIKENITITNIVSIDLKDELDNIVRNK